MKISLTLLILLATSTPAIAAIDISQPVIDAHVDPLDFGQSFTANQHALLSAIRLSIATSSGGSNITLRVHEFDRPTLSLSPHTLATARATESQLSTDPAWIEIPLQTPVPLSAGQTYAFTIVGDDPGGATGWNNYGVSVNDVYPGGEFFFGLAGTVSTNTNLKELAFETIVIPEPRMLAWLLALGVAALRTRQSPCRREKLLRLRRSI